MKHEGYRRGPYSVKVQATLAKCIVAADGIVVADMPGDYDPISAMQHRNSSMDTKTALLLADAPRLAEENERLSLALKSIAEMVVTEYTDHAQLSALCIFVAKTALEGRE